MSWIQKHKIALLVLFVLLALNVYIFLQTVDTNELDYSIQRVKAKLTDSGYHYQIRLQTTQKTPTASTVKFQYEDGSTETRTVLERQKEQLELTSPLRLEYVSLQAPEAETNLTNNSHARNLWSESLSLMKVTSEPDYSFIVDEQDRFWIVCSGRAQEKEKPSILLTILAPDGTILLENQRISPEGVYSVYPVIQQMDDGNMHIVWSSYQNDQDLLYYITYGEKDGQFTILSQTSYIEDEIALLRPTFVSNDPGNPLVAVLVKYQFYSGFALYRLSEEGLIEIPTPIYTDNGITYHNISLFQSLKIKDLVLVRDSQQNYTLIWDEIDSMGLGFFYMTTFDENYQTVNYRNDIAKILATRVHPRLEAIAKDQKLYLFYSEEFTRVDPQNQLCYTIVDEAGESIQEDALFDGPSPLMLRDLTACLDGQGNFNFVWTDARVSKASRLNRDLVFKSLNSQFEPLVPATPLTDNLIDQMLPRLRIFNDQRYLVWVDLKDGAYQLYVKSTYPGFLSAYKAQYQWDHFWTETFHAISIAFVSIGAQLLFLFPLNLFPLVGAVGVMYLFTTNRIRDHWLNWISIFLSMLLLKYINLSLLSKTSILTLAGTYKLSLATCLLTLTLFFLIHQGWKKWQTTALHKSIYLFGWLILDTLILTLIYYFQNI